LGKNLGLFNFNVVSKGFSERSEAKTAVNKVKINPADLPEVAASLQAGWRGLTVALEVKSVKIRIWNTC